MTDTLDAPWKPRYNPWLIALTVTLATFMEVLDTSIANVSLPHIAGSLSASQEESAWVLTSYLVSNAIILPISAWLSTIIGRKRFYMTCVALFTVSSFLCGLAPSLGMLIFFRILQGVGGGGLQPSEQAILADTFPASKRGMAFAVYGMAVVLAPAIGPTLGGWITDNLQLALDFLHQRADRHAFAVPDEPHGRRPAVPETRAGEKKRHSRRLRGPGADHARDRQLADRARQGAGGRLVFVALDYRAGGSGGLRVHGLDRVGVASSESRRGYSPVSRGAISPRRCFSALRWESCCTARRS